jgi:hypothetical protein
MKQETSEPQNECHSTNLHMSGEKVKPDGPFIQGKYIKPCHVMALHTSPLLYLSYIFYM